MLKTRVIPILLVRDGSLVKGRNFDSWRSVGSPIQAVRIYETRQVDELIVLDIGATPKRTGPDFKMIEALVDECFMPLTVGGGVRTLEDIRTLLKIGADKVAINTAAFERPEFIREAADKFGSQAIVVSIDARKADVPYGYEAVVGCGKLPTGVSASLWGVKAESLGAGELLFQSHDNDGWCEGYDAGLLAAIGECSFDVPVVVAGGAGEPAHMLEATKRGLAPAAGAMFHFTEYTPLDVKRCLAREGVPVRL